MAKLDLLIHAWDQAHWELTQAFIGLTDEDLWRRPHPKLLSIGELAGHIIYWESDKFTGFLPEDSPHYIDSDLRDPGFRYYTTEVDEPVSLEMGVEEILAEIARVHSHTKQALLELDPDKDDYIPGQTQATWGFYLEYTGFHIAYHTGQAYSVRHLMGHTTTDN